jgi:hypothetical protein
MLDSLDPLSNPLLLDSSSSIGSLPVVRFPEKLLPEFETFAISKGILGVVTVNSQVDVYAAYLS